MVSWPWALRVHGVEVRSALASDAAEEATGGAGQDRRGGVHIGNICWDNLPAVLAFCG